MFKNIVKINLTVIVSIASILASQNSISHIRDYERDVISFCHYDNADNTHCHIDGDDKIFTLEEMEQAAVAGSASAQTQMGIYYLLDMYDFGMSEESERKRKAIEFFKSAATQGGAEAGWWLYLRGSEDEQSFWLEESALNGHSDAQFTFGTRIINDESKRAEAADFVAKSAAQGNSKAVFHLADLDRAQNKFESAIAGFRLTLDLSKRVTGDKESALAHFWLSELLGQYGEGIDNSELIEHHLTKFSRFYRSYTNSNAVASYELYKESRGYMLFDATLSLVKSAVLGHVEAQLDLAEMYQTYSPDANEMSYEARGQDFKLRKDNQKYMTWLWKASKNGSSLAKYHIATAHSSGLRSGDGKWEVKPDKYAALRFMEMAANAGNSYAISALAQRNRFGVMGWGEVYDQIANASHTDDFLFKTYYKSGFMYVDSLNRMYFSISSDSGLCSADDLESNGEEGIWHFGSQAIAMTTFCAVSDSGSLVSIINTKKGQDFVVNLLKKSNKVLYVNAGKYTFPISPMGFTSVYNSLSDEVF